MDMLTAAELLARWKNAHSKWTLRNWRYQKKGPDYVKIGGKIFYPIKAVEQYERRQMKKAKK
jgi:hypothetical protein